MILEVTVEHVSEVDSGSMTSFEVGSILGRDRLAAELGEAPDSLNSISVANNDVTLSFSKPFDPRSISTSGSIAMYPSEKKVDIAIAGGHGEIVVTSGDRRYTFISG